MAEMRMGSGVITTATAAAAVGCPALAEAAGVPAGGR